MAKTLKFVFICLYFKDNKFIKYSRFFNVLINLLKYLLFKTIL